MTEKAGSAAYKLKLSDTSRVHPMFHVSLLKKCVTLGVTSQPLPLCLTKEEELHMQLEEVIAV